jgi:hypothetical protein
MNSVINFVEFENHVIRARYINLMIGATIVLVDNTSGDQLSDPVIRIASPAPNGLLSIRTPPSLKPGTYFLRALNAHGVGVAQSAAFHIR